MEEVVTFDGLSFSKFENNFLKIKNKKLKEENTKFKEIIIKLASRIADLERKNKNDKIEFL